MPPHEMRPDYTADAPKEPRGPCQHGRGNLRYRTQLQMRTSAPRATAEESLEVTRTSHRDWMFLRPLRVDP